MKLFPLSSSKSISVSNSANDMLQDAKVEFLPSTVVVLTEGEPIIEESPVRKRRGRPRKSGSLKESKRVDIDSDNDLGFDNDDLHNDPTFEMDTDQQDPEEIVEFLEDDFKGDDDDSDEKESDSNANSIRSGSKRSRKCRELQTIS